MRSGEHRVQGDMATLLMRPGDGGSAEKKRRARKGKNAQKKQPQRGRGVAQLEKLRLQEQSLLCPCPPSYALRLSTTDSNQHPMVSCDPDVSQTVLSLTTSNVHAHGGGASCSSSLTRGGEAAAGTLARLSALNGHSATQSCLSSHLTHDLMSKGSNGEALHAWPSAAASRALTCLSQSSKFSSVNGSFFSNVLTATQLQMLENQAQAQQQQKGEERRAAVAAGEPFANAGAAAYAIPSASNYLKEAPGNLVGDEGFKLHPLFKDHIGSAAINMVRADSAKELSSYQSSYASPQAWPTAGEKVSGRKRPWLALQENSRHGGYAQALDLNAPVEESDAQYNECSPALPNKVPEFRVGAHYTTGIVRNALGNSSLPLGAKMKVCSQGSHRQENNDSPSHVTAYFPEMGLYPETAIGFRTCPSQSSIKDSCSSATGSSTYLSRNRPTSLKDSDHPSPLFEKESIRSNFLTLGISSSSFPDRNGWNEPEESIQDNTPTSIHDVSRFRPQESTTSGCEGDNPASQVRKCVYTQEVLGGFDHLKGNPSRSLSLDFDGSGLKKNSSVISETHLPSSSHYNESFPSLPPPSIASNSLGHADESNTDYDPSSKNCTRIVEDILDLRLKLAL